MLSPWLNPMPVWGASFVGTALPSGVYLLCRVYGIWAKFRYINAAGWLPAVDIKEALHRAEADVIEMQYCCQDPCASLHGLPCTCRLPITGRPHLDVIMREKKTCR